MVMKTSEGMAAAAAEWLKSLTVPQRAVARRSFTDTAERLRWYYTPTEQGGLPLADMDPVQQRHAHRLLASGLSERGYALAATIMGLENVLDAAEGWAMPYPGRWQSHRGRDPLMYYVTVFGTPDDPAWGWRVSGHHVAVNYAIVRGDVTAGPIFLGASPATTGLPGANLRPLAPAEDLGRQLVHALRPAQSTTAVLSSAAPPDIVQANRPVVDPGALPKPLWELFGSPLPARAVEQMKARDAAHRTALGATDEALGAVRLGTVAHGLAAAMMTEPQQALLRNLIDHYLDRLPRDVAEPYASQLAQPRHAASDVALAGSGLAAAHFAWAGGTEPGQPHYYRVQAANLLIEYNNTQDGVNHVHSVWRDPGGAFDTAFGTVGG